MPPIRNAIGANGDAVVAGGADSVAQEVATRTVIAVWMMGVSSFIFIGLLFVSLILNKTSSWLNDEVPTNHAIPSNPPASKTGLCNSRAAVV